jgi:hypothetical protein
MAFLTKGSTAHLEAMMTQTRLTRRIFDPAPGTAGFGYRTGQWSDLALLEAELDDPEPLDEAADGPDLDATDADLGDDGTWVSAAPFRAHLRRLIITSGVGWRTVAVLAEMPSSALRRLLHGRNGRPLTRFHPQLASRLLALTPETIAETAQHRRTSRESMAVLRLLLARGWDVDELARRSGLVAGELEAIVEQRQLSCSQLTAATIRAMAQALWEVPPPVRTRPRPTFRMAA